MKKILLETEGLSKSFSSGGTLQHVLKNIDLKLYEGDFTVIMGASGAGKSTLLYALSGMDTPSLGTITFGKEVISGYSSDELAVFRRGSCGFVFQQIYLIDGMNVMDNVLAAGLLVNRDRNALVRRAKELFRAVDIPERDWKKFSTQLSGGEAQRVGIVRALINSPRILFADEPTGTVKLVQLWSQKRNARDVLVIVHSDLGDYGAPEGPLFFPLQAVIDGFEVLGKKVLYCRKVWALICGGFRLFFQHVVIFIIIPLVFLNVD